MFFDKFGKQFFTNKSFCQNFRPCIDLKLNLTKITNKCTSMIN